MRALTTLMMLALLTAPVAFAQENETEKTDEPAARPDDAAWVEDCPPDMMCAYEAPGEAYGDEDCIECSGPADGETCMDGAQAGEACEDDVQYLDGPTRGPADGSCEDCRGDGETEALADDAKPVPMPAALAILAVASALVFVAMRR